MKSNSFIHFYRKVILLLSNLELYESNFKRVNCLETYLIVVSTHVVTIAVKLNCNLKFILWDSYGSPNYRNIWMTFVKGKSESFSLYKAVKALNLFSWYLWIFHLNVEFLFSIENIIEVNFRQPDKYSLLWLHKERNLWET